MFAYPAPVYTLLWMYHCENEMYIHTNTTGVIHDTAGVVITLAGVKLLHSVHILH